MADERPIRDGLVSPPLRRTPRRPRCASRAEAGRAAQRALENFGRLCRGVLYFSALTGLDLERNCDPLRTDANVHLRSAHWYRVRLKRRFREAGLGFWLRRGAPLTLWELECR